MEEKPNTQRKVVFITFFALLLVPIAILFAIGLPNPDAPKKLEIRSVAVLGDSLVFLSSKDIATSLDAKGWKNQSKGYPGMTAALSHQAPEIRAEQPFETLLAGKPDVFVVALGSNDAHLIDSEGMDQILTSQKTYLNALKDTPCVIWVGVQVDTPVLQLEKWGSELNHRLRRGLDSYPNAHFLDWGWIQQHHPEYRNADGAHFTEAGNAAYGEAIAKAVADSC